MSGVAKTVVKGVKSFLRGFKAPPPPPPPPSVPVRPAGPSPEDIAQMAQEQARQADLRRAQLAASSIEPLEGVVEQLTIQQPAGRRARRLLSSL